MGLDLAAVRVHAGAAAETLACEQRAHAFTYGNHVVLGRNAQHASHSARAQVLAHELVHVGQQSPIAASSAAPHRPRERAPPAVQRLEDDDTSILPAWVSSAASAAVEIGAEAVETVAETGAAVVERFAPGLLGFLNGDAVVRLDELFCTGVDTLVGRAFSAIGDFDFMSTIESTFTELAKGVRHTEQRLREKTSEKLGEAMGWLVEALATWGTPILATVQGISDTINGVYTSVWEGLAVPALDFLQGVGGEVWARVSRMVSWVWEITEPLRTGARLAWNWLLEEFHLAWDSTSGVMDTVRAWAADAWTSFQQTIEPIRKPLMVAGGILVLLSPLGPVVILAEVIPPLWEKITWLWKNWNTSDILVRARDVLREDVVPGILGAIGGVAGAFSTAASWLAGLATQFGTAMSDVLAAFGVSRCLHGVLTYLEGLAAVYGRFAAWATSGFSGLVPAIQAVFDALDAIARPILAFLGRMAMVAINPLMLPIALTAELWLLCPDHLKPPVINFIFDLLIAFLSGFPALLLGIGALGIPVKAAILGYLGFLRGSDGVVTDDTRTAVANKIASTLASGGAYFAAGFIVGLLEGLIDGIIDPFRMIFTIVKFVVVAASAIGRALAPLVRAVPGIGTALDTAAPRAPPVDADVAADLETAAAEPVPDTDALEAQARAEVEGEGSSITGLAGLLGAAWDWMLGAAGDLGATIAGWLLTYIMLPDYELGSKLGFLTGFVLFQLLIIYLTAGEYAALKALEPALREAIILFLRFLDLGGEIFSVVGKALKPFLGPLMRGVGAAGKFAAKLPFVRGLIEVIEHWLGKLARFAERVGGRAESRVATEAAEDAAAQIARRGEREVVEGAEHAAAQTARRGEREAAEATETAAERASQVVRLRLEARAFTEAAEKAHVPVSVLLPSLDAWFMPRYRWLSGFISEPLPIPGHYRLAFTASAPTTFDPDYRPGRPLTQEQLRRPLPAGTRVRAARQRALDFINGLPAKERRFLLNRLSTMSPDEAGALLTRLDAAGVDRMAFIEGLYQRRTKLPPDIRSEWEEAVEAHMPKQFDEALEHAPHMRVEKPVTWRVSPDELQAGRQVLKDRMQDPWWAHGDSRLWNPHHVIPVECQRHPIFDVLRANGGWDHHLPANGIALPTTAAAAAEAKLPMHQWTLELMQQPERAVLQQLQFHPVYNERVWERLNDLYASTTNPAALRTGVLDIIGELKLLLYTGGLPVLH